MLASDFLTHVEEYWLVAGHPYVSGINRWQ
jgi:hypothetical protein